eukprot:6211226-Pleurochrysis_carterae.AAC.2
MGAAALCLLVKTVALCTTRKSGQPPCSGASKPTLSLYWSCERVRDDRSERREGSGGERTTARMELD